MVRQKPKKIFIKMDRIFIDLKDPIVKKIFFEKKRQKRSR